MREITPFITWREKIIYIFLLDTVYILIIKNVPLNNAIKRKSFGFKYPKNPWKQHEQLE
jgi:hypothetical protein